MATREEQSENQAEATLASGVWAQRSLGIELPKNIKSALHNDVKYLCNNVYPFIQVVNTDAVFTDETTLTFIPIANGWIIHDYGEAISAAAPHDIAGRESGSVGAAATAPSPVVSGAEISAQIAVAEEIAKIIAEKGWKSAEFISGTDKMFRFLWIEAKRYGIEIQGYTPTPADERCYSRLEKNAQKAGIAWDRKSTLKPKMQEVGGAGGE